VFRVLEAREPEAPKARERATVVEPTKWDERAKEQESTRACERATESEPTITGERAMYDREGLREAVRHFYDIQTVRMQHSGRISRKAAGNEVVISDEQRSAWAAQVKRLEGVERDALTVVKEKLERIPLWTEVLSQDDERWTGLGPTMAGVLLSEVDITRATTVSKLWRFAGLAPVAAWRCQSCARVVQRTEAGWEHTKKKSNERTCEFEKDALHEGQVRDSGSAERSKKGEKRHYNLFLKTKLLGVLAGSFLRTNKGAGNAIWRPVYDNYKHRLESSGRSTSPGQLHKASSRYMIKMFLIEFWKEWRQHEGLEVRPPYQEEKLQHRHVG